MLLLAMKEFPATSSSGCDEALEQKAANELKGCGYGPLGKLSCRVQDGVVELAGFVPTFFLKQMAQTVVLRVESVRGVRNKVQVQ